MSLSSTPSGIRLTIQVQPRASRTELAGRYGDALKIRLQSPPVDGAANEALIRFIAESLGVQRTAVRITAGQGARRKVVTIEGITAREAAARLKLEPAEPSG